MGSTEGSSHSVEGSGGMVAVGGAVDVPDLPAAERGFDSVARAATDAYLSAQENGLLPWQKGSKKPNHPPYNPANGQFFGGQAGAHLAIVQATEGWEDSRWVTRAAMAERGWSVPSTVKGVQITYLDENDRVQVTEVFNGSQVRGLSEYQPKKPLSKEGMAKVLQAFLPEDATNIVENGVDIENVYGPRLVAEVLYRANRRADGGRHPKGSPEYAKALLATTLAAYQLGARLGPVITQHVKAYQETYADAMRADPFLLRKAAVFSDELVDEIQREVTQGRRFPAESRQRHTTQEAVVSSADSENHVVLSNANVVGLREQPPVEPGKQPKDAGRGTESGDGAQAEAGDSEAAEIMRELQPLGNGSHKYASRIRSSEGVYVRPGDPQAYRYSFNLKGEPLGVIGFTPVGDDESESVKAKSYRLSGREREVGVAMWGADLKDGDGPVIVTDAHRAAVEFSNIQDIRDAKASVLYARPDQLKDLFKELKAAYPSRPVVWAAENVEQQRDVRSWAKQAGVFVARTRNGMRWGLLAYRRPGEACKLLWAAAKLAYKDLRDDVQRQREKQESKVTKELKKTVRR